MTVPLIRLTYQDQHETVLDLPDALARLHPLADATAVLTDLTIGQTPFAKLADGSHVTLSVVFASDPPAAAHDGVIEASSVLHEVQFELSLPHIPIPARAVVPALSRDDAQAHVEAVFAGQEDLREGSHITVDRTRSRAVDTIDDAIEANEPRLLGRYLNVDSVHCTGPVLQIAAG